MVTSEGKILVGKRKGSHAQKWSIPGGHLELGHTFEFDAVREIKEETDLDIENPRVIAVTNNLETYREEAKHYVSVILLADRYSGELKNTEPDKCEEWRWVDPVSFQNLIFDASRLGVECYLKKSASKGLLY